MLAYISKKNHQGVTRDVQVTLSKSMGRPDTVHCSKIVYLGMKQPRVRGL